MSQPDDLPKDAGRRLEELEHGLFTSDLSVNEFLLIKEVGFHPLGFVMGSSIYHTGIQTRKWGQSQELTKLTEAMYNARELAMTRMEEEADRARRRRRRRRPARRQLLRVGQRRRRVHRRRHRGQGRETATRTATSWASPSPPTCPARTSGRIMQTGHVPQGLVMGTCVYHIAHRGLGQTLGLGRPERRAPQLHPGPLRGARAGHDPDAGRGQRARRPPASSGCASRRSRTSGASHTIEFLSLGTAVVKTADDVTLPRPDHHHLPRQLMAGRLPTRGRRSDSRRPT